MIEDMQSSATTIPVKKPGRRPHLSVEDELTVFALYRVHNWTAKQVMEKFPVIRNVNTVRVIANRVEVKLKGPGSASDQATGAENPQRPEGAESREDTPEAA